MMKWTILLLFISFLCVGCKQKESTHHGGSETSQKKSEDRADDMQVYLDRTEELIDQGCYKEALDRCVWFHEHAIEHDPGMYGVRLSFALRDWKKLGDVYPPAKKALLDVRNRKTQQLKNGGGNASLFLEVAALNSTLNENAETVRLFREIDNTNSTLASQCWDVAQGAVFAEKQYDIAKKYFKSPLREYERVKAQYDYDMGIMDDDSRYYGEQFKQWTENHFIEACIKLIEAAKGVGDKEAAQEIRKRAASVLNDPRIRETTTLEPEK